MTEPHVAYMDSRYMYTEELPDGTDKDHYTEERPIYCGNWHMGSLVLCDSCEAKAEKYYPQGWNYYPGDVCPHGMYTGGCGIDLMCHQCETGDDDG